MKATKNSVLKELAGWSLQLLTFAMNDNNCDSLDELVARIQRRYPFADDLEHLKADYEYAYLSSQKIAKDTKFEKILSDMNLDEKAGVLRHLGDALDMFKEKCGDSWLDDMCGDEPLRNLYIMSGIASIKWLKHHNETLDNNK